MRNPVQEQAHLGRPVRSLQQMLRTVHFVNPEMLRVTPNGIFDENTERALRQFQALQGLPVTGQADYDTWTALRTAHFAAERELAHALPLRVIFQRGERILPGQAHLHLYPYQAALVALGNVLDVPPLRVTGRHDQASQEATRWLQLRSELPVDGVVDKPTWDAVSWLYPAVMGDGGMPG